MENFFQVALNSSISNQTFLAKMPDLKNLRLNVLDEVMILFNISNFQISSNSISDTDLEIMFDDKSQSVNLYFDEMNFKISLNYQVAVVPPIFADEGSIIFDIQKLKLVMGLQGIEENGIFKIKIVQFTPTISKEDMTFTGECFADFTRQFFDDVIFFQDLLVNELLSIIQSDAQEFAQYILDIIVDRIPQSIDLIYYSYTELVPFNGNLTTKSNTLKLFYKFQTDPSLKFQYLAATSLINVNNQQDQITNKLTVKRDQIQSFLNNRFDMQVFLSREFCKNFMNYAASMPEEMVRFYITKKPEGMPAVYYNFLKQLDSEFIYSMIPEIYKNNNTGYVLNNRTNSSCILKLTMLDFSQLNFQETFAQVEGLTRMDIYCIKNLGVKPIAVNASSNLSDSQNYSFVLSLYMQQRAQVQLLIRDMRTLVMNLTQYNLTLVSVNNSQIGQVATTKLLRDSMQILSQVVRSSLTENALGSGFQLEQTNTFQYAIKYAEFTFKRDYLQVMLNPDIIKADLQGFVYTVLGLSDGDFFQFIMNYVIRKIIDSQIKQPLNNTNLQNYPQSRLKQCESQNQAKLRHFVEEDFQIDIGEKELMQIQKFFLIKSQKKYQQLFV